MNLDRSNDANLRDELTMISDSETGAVSDEALDRVPRNEKVNYVTFICATSNCTRSRLGAASRR
jgi:hypothetical protein